MIPLTQDFTEWFQFETKDILIKVVNPGNFGGLEKTYLVFVIQQW